MTGRRSVRIACPRPSGRGNATILYDASRSDAELRRMWLLYVILSWHRSSAAHIIFFMLSHGSASLHRGLSTASAHPRLCGRHGISRTGKACKAEPTVARSVNSGDENNTIKKRSVGPIQNVAVGWSGVRSGGHRRGAPVWGACVGRLCGAPVWGASIYHVYDALCHTPFPLPTLAAARLRVGLTI